MTMLKIIYTLYSFLLLYKAKNNVYTNSSMCDHVYTLMTSLTYDVINILKVMVNEYDFIL